MSQSWLSVRGVSSCVSVHLSPVRLVAMQRISRTSNDMCSVPNRISNSWRPSLFFCGHFESSSFMISLDFTIRLISSTTNELTHTIEIPRKVSVLVALGGPRGVKWGWASYTQRSQCGSVACRERGMRNEGRALSLRMRLSFR